jgi:hypothetical protein
MTVGMQPQCQQAAAHLQHHIVRNQPASVVVELDANVSPALCPQVVVDEVLLLQVPLAQSRRVELA